MFCDIRCSCRGSAHDKLISLSILLEQSLSIHTILVWYCRVILKGAIWLVSCICMLQACTSPMCSQVFGWGGCSQTHAHQTRGSVQPHAYSTHCSSSSSCCLQLSSSSSSASSSSFLLPSSLFFLCSLVRNYLLQTLRHLRYCNITQRRHYRVQF